MKIGNITLKHGLMLAPLAGYTNAAFREICAEHGAEDTVSEMISAKAVCLSLRVIHPLSPWDFICSGQSLNLSPEL